MDRMHTIALISRKGGAGKTTLACALAVAAARGGHSSVLVDLDPQGSGAIWHGLRQATTPVFTRTADDRLTRVLRAAAKTGANFAVIDTAPDTDAGTRAAARAADVILIPCRPAAADLSAIRVTVQIAQRAGTRTYAILNAAPVPEPPHRPGPRRLGPLRAGHCPRSDPQPHRPRPRVCAGTDRAGGRTALESGARTREPLYLDRRSSPVSKQPDLASAVHDASAPHRATNRRRRYTTATTRDGTKGVLTHVRPSLAKQLRRNRARRRHDNAGARDRGPRGPRALPRTGTG